MAGPAPFLGDGRKPQVRFPCLPGARPQATADTSLADPRRHVGLAVVDLQSEQFLGSPCAPRDEPGRLSRRDGAQEGAAPPPSAHGDAHRTGTWAPGRDLRSCVTFYLETDGNRGREGDGGPPGLTVVCFPVSTAESCNCFK